MIFIKTSKSALVLIVITGEDIPNTVVMTSAANGGGGDFERKKSIEIKKAKIYKEPI